MVGDLVEDAKRPVGTWLVSGVQRNIADDFGLSCLL